MIILDSKIAHLPKEREDLQRGVIRHLWCTNSVKEKSIITKRQSIFKEKNFLTKSFYQNNAISSTKKKVFF